VPFPTRLALLAGIRPLLALAVLAVALAGRAAGAERELAITAPPNAVPGADVEVTVTAATHLGGGERIGFFHGEFSNDGGRTWTGFCYEQNQGAEMTRVAHVHAGPAPSRIIVRVRVAFRDGAAGDVDYTGAAIRWSPSWENWREPPAKSVTIPVLDR